jgi:YD repeat-containing protein
VTSKTDPLTNSTAITYDRKNNPTNRIDALSGVTLFRYDGSGNLTNAVNALGKTNAVRYDSFGQPLVLTNPMAKTPPTPSTLRETSSKFRTRLAARMSSLSTWSVGS